MEILGIGAPELIFVIIIAIIVLGPRDMQKAGMTIGKWIRSIVTSDAWRATQQVSREAQKQLTLLVRNANEDLNNINKESNKIGKLINDQTARQYVKPKDSVPLDEKEFNIPISPDTSSSTSPQNSTQPPPVETPDPDNKKHE